MRIALLVTDLTPPRIGGISKVATELAYAYCEAGHDVEVFCLERCVDSHRDAPFVIHGISPDWMLYKDYPVVSFSLTAFRALLSRHREKPFDVSHAMNFNNYGLTFHRSKMTKLGLAHVSTGFETTQMEIQAKWREFKSRPNLHCLAQIVMELYLAPWQRSYLGWGNVITTEDVETKEGLEAMGLDGDKIELIPSGIDLASIEKEKQENTLPEKWFSEKDEVWVCPGRVDARKGSQYLIRAFAKVADRFPKKKLLFAGGGRGDYIDSMRDLVRELGLEAKVQLVGRVEELGPYYRCSEAVIIPSLSEGIPITLQEAMAFEKPVVCSKLKGTYHYAKEVPSVLWAEAAHVDQFAEQMTALGDGKVSSAAIQQGYDFVKGFDWKEVAKAYLTAYERAKSALSTLDE